MIAWSTSSVQPFLASVSQGLDEFLFRLINIEMGRPWLDGLMKFLSGNAAFFPLLLLIGAWLLWKAGRRGRVLVFVMTVAVLINSEWVCDPLKDWLQRPRPNIAVPGARVLGPIGGNGSMPSCHAGNWGVIVVVAWWYFRRSWRWLLPMAAAVGLSRIYLAAHYPSDVLVGLLLGMVTGSSTVFALDWVWTHLGAKFFPGLAQSMPSLAWPDRQPMHTKEVSASEIRNSWRWGAWLLIVGVTLARWITLRSGVYHLTEDEAYQWLWSRHLDWSYYSKPPFIAICQWVGTHLFGPTEFGVRFLSPLFGALMTAIAWRFLERETSAKTAFWFVVALLAVPLSAAGSLLMTIDSPSCLFYSLAMISSWKAIQTDKLRYWIETGVWAAGSFLTKYFSPFIFGSLLLFLLLSAQHRVLLRRKGFWIALGISLLGLIPVVYWNAQRDWITLKHLAERGGMTPEHHWSLRFVGDFILQVSGLLNPFFFIPCAWAAVRFWKKDRDPILKFLFAFSIPIFLLYLFVSLKARGQPNWVSPAMVPFFLLGAIYWHRRMSEGSRAGSRWLIAGVAVGLPAFVLLFDLGLWRRAMGRPFPNESALAARIHSGPALAEAVQAEREALLKQGKKVDFLIADHYGRASLLNFYLPEAKELPNTTLACYVLRSPKPQNQYWFWEGFEARKGQNALFVQQTDKEKKPHKELKKQFKKVTSLGSKRVKWGKNELNRVQFYYCEGKRK